MSYPSGVRLAAELLDIGLPFDLEAVQRAFRKAALKAHPDHGGSDREFRAVTQARDLLLEYANTPRDSERDSAPRTRWSPTYDCVPLGWRTSRKGNLWRRWGDLVVTVFPSDGGFRWVCDGEFSDDVYATQAEACHAACDEFGR